MVLGPNQHVFYFVLFIISTIPQGLIMCNCSAHVHYFCPLTIISSLKSVIHTTAEVKLKTFPDLKKLGYHVKFCKTLYESTLYLTQNKHSAKYWVNEKKEVLILKKRKKEETKERKNFNQLLSPIFVI